MMYENGYLREFDPRVACAVGVNAACIIGELDHVIKTYDTSPKRSDMISIDGHIWVRRTLDDWHERLEWVCTKTIKTDLKSIREKGLVLTNNYNKFGFDRTLWYTIDYVALERLLAGWQ